MDTKAAVTILKASEGARRGGDEKDCVIHSIPCKTDYNGEANVEGYFLRESVEGEGRERAALRGRRLEGTAIQLPEGFQAAVLKEKTNGRYEIERVLGNTNGINFWEHDREPSERSSLARALAFLPVASALAAPASKKD